MPVKNSLTFYIAKMFFIILSILAILLISLNYKNTKKLNTHIAKERIWYHAKDVKLSYQNITSPIRTLLNALASSKAQHSALAFVDEHLLKSIATTFKNNRLILSVNLGFNNGDYAFVRTMYPEFMRSNYLAPNKARLQVELFQYGSEKTTRFYYDNNIAMISNADIKQHFDPRIRPWYVKAIDNEQINITAPYRYSSIKTMGISFAKRLNNQQGVIAVDITLEALTQFIDNLALFKHYPTAKLFITDKQNHIFYSKEKDEKINQFILEKASEEKKNGSAEKIELNNHVWWLTKTLISKDDETPLYVITLIDEKALLSDAIQAFKNQLFYAVIVLVIGIILILLASKKIVSPLNKFTELANTFSHLNFKGIKIPKSDIKEIDALSKAFFMVGSTIDRFLITLTLISSTENLKELLQNIVEQSKDIAHANFALLWTEKEKNQIGYAAHCPKSSKAFKINYQALIKDIPTLEKAMETNQPFLFSAAEHTFTHCQFPKEIKRAWVIPMVNRQNSYCGCLMLGFREMQTPVQEGRVHFLHAFLGFISLIHENWAHIHAQKQLFLSLTEMIASAIDAKSPYTGGHCQRVPELSFMLAAAVNQDKTYYPNFFLDENAREALQLAAWLHDCGKVTTPEYVIDKATKLETLHNRIHEIRTRFEVLKRDKEIHYLKQRLENKKPLEKLDSWLKNQWQTLDKEFAFIAKLNIGEQEITEKDIEKLNSIASRTWLRTLDDSIGISWEEKDRLSECEPCPLPCKEFLLKDSKTQEIPWQKAQQKQFKDWPYKMQASKLQFNRGELYNLKIKKGTLTDEERFIINNHIVQTINMLTKLPYPEHLARIPEIAGGHHERLDGKGYPKGLDEKHFSLDARIIALADVFEALTARDRPYKTLKTVNQSLIILAKMARERHIDKGLFRIFVEQKIYADYAKRFLTPGQNDPVDESLLFAILEEDE